MKTIFDSVIEKYRLESNTYEADELVTGSDLTNWLNKFIGKWKDRFVEGYWNVDLSYLPKRWYDAIDEALDIVKEDSPEFKIAQIKVKFGGVRIYLFDISDKVFYAVDELEKVLYDDRFYY